MEWCSRSEYIVCGLQNKQIVQVRNIMGAGFLLACPSCAAPISMAASCCQEHADLQRASSLTLQVWSASDQDWTCKIDEVSHLDDASPAEAVKPWSESIQHAPARPSSYSPLACTLLRITVCRGPQVSGW